MRGNLLFTLCAVIAFLLHVNQASAATTTDKVFIDEFYMLKGEQQVVDLQLANNTHYTAFQCDVILPEGLTVATNGQGSPMVELASAYKNTHVIQSSTISNGAVRIVVMSMSNVSFSQSSVVANLTISASADAVGVKNIDIKNVRVVSVDNRTEYKAPDTQTTVHVMAQKAVITAKSCSRKYGEDNPEFDYTVEGPEIDGVPEITCSATAKSPVGTYDIVIKQGTVKNTCVTFVAGKLTIEKAPLTIAAGTYTKKQGDPMPEFTLTYTGFKNSETKAVLTKQPTVSCEATVASAPGEYVVTVSGAEAQNYDISYTNGKLVVAAADAAIVKAKSYTREYGEANPTFEYTVEGAALNGTPEITCEATATSPVGTYDIVVKQGTVSNYNVTYVAGTLTITKASLNIAAGTYTKKQGDPMPEFTLTYTGFKNNETKDVLTKLPEVNCNATEASAPGEYPVTVSGAEAQNYDISYTSGKLVVSEADLVTITAKSYTRVYGDANPTFDFTTEGAALDGLPEISCEATATSPVGTYDILISKGTVKNYNVAYVAGTLTITKAPLTIAADTYTKKQGDPMPEFTLSYEGFKNDETKDVLIKQPEIICDADESSAPGEYPVLIGGAEAQNYDISYVNGKLIVVDADAIIVKAKSYRREYGEENPSFEYTIEGDNVDGVPEITCEATPTSPVGTYDIVVKQGTISNYNVTYVAGTLTITKAALNIAAGTYTKKQGEALPEFTLTYTGFKNNETKDVLTKQPEVSCNATAESVPGEYQVIVSDAEAQNYDISYTNGLLVVTEADPMTITAKSYTRQYGEDNPSFEYTVEGAALNGTPEIVCEATATSPVGTYDIVVKQGTVKNFNVTYVAGTLTIEKAPLTIAAGTYTKKQGDPMPEFTLTYTGFKNNETKDVLTKLPEVSCEATEESAPGEYQVVVSGAEARNYDISYTNGKLIVSEADLITITAKSYSRQYGDANPTFEYTVEGGTLNGTPEIVCEATATSPVGIYNIVVKQGTVKNFKVSYVDGTLTVEKALLTVKAGNYTRETGQENPEFELSYEGWKNGENESVLLAKPTATTNATVDSPAGDYVITVSGGEAQNYAFEYVNGVLTVIETSGIAEINASGKPLVVYTVSGKKLIVTSLKALPQGVYIVNGRKVIVKR